MVRNVQPDSLPARRTIQRSEMQVNDYDNVEDVLLTKK